jgi:hypothetical protein
MTPSAALRRAATDQETPFEIHGVPPGRYDFYPLFADSSSGTTNYYTARTPITVGSENISNLAITIRPNLKLSGRFVLDNTASMPLNGIRLQLRPTEVLPLQVRAIAFTPINNPADEFTVDVPESTFHVMIPNLPAPAYVADIRQGNRSIYETGIVDTRNGPPAPIEIIVRGDGASIRGTVSKPSNQSAMVLLRPVRENPQLYKRSTANPASGQFTLSGIAPGDYVLYAFPSVPPGAEENAEFMARYKSQGVPVTLRASEMQQVQLTMTEDPALLLPEQVSVATPEISNRIIRNADTPVVTADSGASSPGPQRGTLAARGARGAAARGAAVVATAVAGNRGAVADRETIERNLALTPGTPEERTQLLGFLLQNGNASMVSDRPLAERLLRRGKELDPENWQWPGRLGQLYYLASLAADTSGLQLTQAEAAAKSQQEYERAVTLGQRRLLQDAAESARVARDPAKATDYANQAIATGDPDSVHQAHNTLGRIALEKEDVASAKTHLLASANVAGSPVLGSFGPNMQLANDLLRRGERQTVIAYLERCLAFGGQADVIKGWISAIRNGETPTLTSSTGR